MSTATETKKGEMRILGRLVGDTKIIWDPSKEAEVNNAKKTFEDLTGKGYKAFKVRDDGEPGEQVTEFPKGEAKLILAPAIAGG